MWDFYRSSDGSTKLVTLEWIDRRRKEISRIEHPVANILKQITVERPSAGFGDDIHDAPGVLAVLSSVITGLYAELLKRVWERKRLIHHKILVVIIAAVEHEVRIRGSRPVHRDRKSCGKVSFESPGRHRYSGLRSRPPSLLIAVLHSCRSEADSPRHAVR